LNVEQNVFFTILNDLWNSLAHRAILCRVDQPLLPLFLCPEFLQLSVFLSCLREEWCNYVHLSIPHEINIQLSSWFLGSVTHKWS
jgi:hypothetical protein